MKARHWPIPLLAAVAGAMVLVGPAWAHEGEASVPAVESFATAMSLLQVQPDMTDMIADKIGDGLESDETEGIDLELARQAQKAYEAGDNAEALDLLAQATGLTPAEALTMQTEDVTRPSEVPIADQLETPGSAGRPGPTTIAVLAFGALVAIGVGVWLARRTR